MKEYIKKDVFETFENAFIFVNRNVGHDKVRFGLVGMLDLDEYSYEVNSNALCRATEQTVLERIPPRVKIRKDAPLELPHIMLLIDDKDNIVMNSIDKGEMLYNFDLMQDSGSISGYLVKNNIQVMDAIDKLNKNGFLFAVGDGNHSLATAKAHWESIKKTIPQSEWEKHPAKYALVEIVNIYDNALEFEPIHRVLFNVDVGHFLALLKDRFGGTIGNKVKFYFNGGQDEIYIDDILPLSPLQNFLDDYLSKYGGKIDYIHGDDVTKELGEIKSNIGIKMAKISKENFFEMIQKYGILPRKTFSMGHAYEKRFYLECRRIR